MNDTQTPGPATSGADDDSLLHPSFHARRDPGRTAWVMAGSGERVTYGELDATSNRIAHLLRARGLGIGDGVVVLLPNRPDTLLVYWGVQRAGLFYTPVSIQYQQAEIAHVLADSDAKVFVTVTSQLERVQGLPVLAGMPHRFLLDGRTDPADGPAFEHLHDALATMPATALPDDTEGGDMLYSSGTTGFPKGVRTAGAGNPLGTVSALFRRRLAWHGMDASTVYLSTAPLYHSAPLRYSTMTLRLGGTVVIMERFEPEQALASIERHRVTHSQWVPTMLGRLLRLPDEVKARHDLSSHRFAVHAAAPCPVEVKQGMLDWWGPILYEYYSGTEGNGQTVISPEEWLRHRGSVGRPIHGILHICDADGRECAPFETGTVYFEAGSDFAYYKDPEKTARARNVHGWTTLGDIGHVDGEGYLYLTDRASFMIISGGVNIYPQEVENVLVTHPAVQDAAVFGIPDADFGEQVKAAIELVPGVAASAELADALIAFCRARLAHLKCPRSIDFHPRLPRHDTGKLYKKALRDAYWATR